MSDDGYMVEERRRLLLAELGERRRVIAAEAAARFGVSEDTIRRDLRQLAAEGLVQRVRGGALPLAPATKPYRARVHADLAPLASLASVVAHRLSSTGGVVVLDSGVTSLRVAESLEEDSDLTVVTSSPSIGAAASMRGIPVLMLGGFVDPTIGAAVDATATVALRGVRADTAVLGTCAVDPEIGVTTARPDEIEFKKAVVAAGTEVLVVATAEKLNTATPFRVAPTHAIDVVVTEALVDEGLTAAFSDAGVEVLRA